MGRDGYEVEMRGGPLGGGTARVRDTEVRLAVVRESGRLYVRDPSTEPLDLSASARVIGTYGFSRREEALVWYPAL